VVPFTHPDHDTMGFGRYFNLSEIGLLFLCAADGGGVETPAPAVGSADWYKLRSNTPPGDTSGIPPNRTLDPNVKLAADERRVEMLILLDLTSVAQGTPVMFA